MLTHNAGGQLPRLPMSQATRKKQRTSEVQLQIGSREHEGFTGMHPEPKVREVLHSTLEILYMTTFTILFICFPYKNKTEGTKQRNP